MNRTTLIVRTSEMTRQPLPNCHGGQGALDWTNVLDHKTSGCANLFMWHDDILPPGASIGVHTHERDTEYYYVVEGRGTMTLDGESRAIARGDITAVFPGGSHGLVNDSDADLRIIVVGVKP